MTAENYITRALRSLGVIQATEVPDAESMQAGFELLNEMIDAWGTQRLTVFVVARTLFPLTAAQASYTIGTGGNFNIVRPVWITSCSIVPDDTVAIPLEIPCGPPLTIQQFQRIAQKLATNTYPYSIYYDHAWTAGLGTIQVYPVPTSSLASLVLYTPTALVRFADLVTDYTFPPGYEKAIRSNLSVVMMPDWNRLNNPIRIQFMKDEAVSSLADVKRANWQPVDLNVDAAMQYGPRRSFNVMTGEGG